MLVSDVLESDNILLSMDIDYNGFYVSRIVRQFDHYKIQISYKGNNSQQSIYIGTTGVISSKLSLIDYTTQASQRIYPVIIQNPEFKLLQITLCIGDTITYTAGTQDISAQNGAIDMHCVSVYRPVVQGISSINGLQGDITIQASDDIVIEVDYDKKIISISKKESNGPQEYLGVKTINGIEPDADGNIQIIGSDCLKVQHLTGNTISIQNPCGKPCCDSTTIDSDILNAISTLTFQKQILKQSMVSIANNLNYMQANLSVLMG